jgi:isocitrate/isopropylmalate dehydrogenase
MAKKQRKILLLPGDGVGPEVVGETKKLLIGLMKKIT